MSYTVLEEAARVVIKFVDYVVDDPDGDQEKKLLELAGRFPCVAFDLSATRAIPTRWLRLFWHVTKLAKNTGKNVWVVGIKPEVSRKADLIALKSELKFAASLEEAK